MAAPKKKRVEQMDVVESDEDAELLDDDLSSEDEDFDVNEEVQVDFEAKTPQDSDLHGIKSLLQQLFLKANVNISQLAETIISQNYVGSVIKQCDLEEVDSSDEDDDDSDDSPVFGLISVINLTEKKNLDCVKQVKKLLLDKCAACAQHHLEDFKKILNGDDKQIGLLLSERFINIPPEIAVPMYESLRKDLDSVKVQKMKYKFDSYLMICKTYRLRNSGKKLPKVDPQQTIFANPEEAFLFHRSEPNALALNCEGKLPVAICREQKGIFRGMRTMLLIHITTEYIKHASHSFDYSVATERDTLVDGKRDEDDDMESFRTVILIPADKLDATVAEMKSAISSTAS